MIQQLLQQTNLTSIVLVILLIIAFVVAFKIMEMIFDTMLIAGVSAAFYIGLRMIQGGPLNVNDLLLFTFLGASVYMMYSFLASLYRIGATVLPIPYHIVKTVLKPFGYLAGKAREVVNNADDYAPDQTRSSKKKEKEEEEKDHKDKTTKEVILGNKKEDKGEDEE